MTVLFVEDKKCNILFWMSITIWSPEMQFNLKEKHCKRIIIQWKNKNISGYINWDLSQLSECILLMHIHLYRVAEKKLNQFHIEISVKPQLKNIFSAIVQCMVCLQGYRTIMVCRIQKKDFS